MNETSSLEKWKNLYEAAIEFRDIQSWNWMWDKDLFGVKDPISGEIGYCCVLGKLGEVMGLAVYRGSDGLEGYLKIQSGEVLPEDVDPAMIPRCLLVSFEDRNQLQKPDLNLIKKLNLKFRGRSQWPLFRSYSPGYFPWYLTEEEVRYLTLMLQQAKDVSLRFKENPNLLTSPRKGFYFVRVAKDKSGKSEWRDEWLKAQLVQKKDLIEVEVDRLRLQRIEEIANIKPMVWESDFFYLPIPVKERNERPYYPYALLWVDHSSGFILHVHIATPGDYASEYITQFLNLLESIKIIPSEILVRKEETLYLLKPIVSELGIRLKCLERLGTIEDLQKNMSKFLPENGEAE